MKTKQAKRKVCIAVGVAVLVCLSLFLILLFYRNREEKIKLGMSMEEAVAILEKQNYPYEIRELKDSSLSAIIYVKKVVFKGIDGSLYIEVDFDNRVYRISFMSDMSDEKVAVLDKYLYGKYGEPMHIEPDEKWGKVISLYFQTDDKRINYDYPTDENTSRTNIAVTWSYRTSY